MKGTRQVRIFLAVLSVNWNNQEGFLKMKYVVLNEYKQMILLSLFVLVLVHSTALATITHISHMVTWLIFRLGLFLALGIYLSWKPCFTCVFIVYVMMSVFTWLKVCRIIIAYFQTLNFIVPWENCAYFRNREV